MWYLRGAFPVMELEPERPWDGGGLSMFEMGEASEMETPVDGSARVCREHCWGLVGRMVGRRWGFPCAECPECVKSFYLLGSAGVPSKRVLT